MRRITLGRSKRTISAAIFVVALLVRLIPMGLYVTPDEPIWVLRSLRFYDALGAGDLSAIPQTGHPGMTTMAFGALSIAVNNVMAPEETAAHANWLRNIAWLAPENSAAFPHLYHFLPLARLFVALTTSLCVALLYLILCKRLGKRTAVLAALFIALSPFLTGLSGLLHTDALQASFAMLAVTLVLPIKLLYRNESRCSTPSPCLSPTRGEGSGKPAGSDIRSHSWLAIILTALCLALAGMSKTLGWLIAPGAALILLFSWRGLWWQRIGVTAVLTLATLAFAALLYPPLWVQPVEAFNALVGAVGYHADLGLRDVFFMGEMRANPGVWFYPAVLLFRLTPPVLLGLVLELVRFIWSIKGQLLNKSANSPLPPRERERVRGGHWHAQASWLIVPTLIYLLGITVATKKFDRYAVSVFPMLAIIAAAQWQHLLRQRQYLKRVVLALLLLPIALTLVLPFYFADPLVGGPWVAKNVIPLGWGEGAGLAANKLNTSLIGGDALITDNVPGAAPFYRGSVYAWNFDLLSCTSVYVGDGVHTLDTFALHIAGIPIVHITPTENISASRPLMGVDTSLCDFVMSASQAADSIATFDGNLDLLNYHISAINQAPDALTLKLRWLPQSTPSVRNVYLVLHGVDDILVWDEGGGQLIALNGWPAEKWIPGEVIDAEAYIPLDRTMPPGTYRLGLRLIGPDSNWLGITLPDGEFAGVELDLGEVEIATPRYQAGELDLPVLVDVPFEGGTLAGYSTLPEQRYAGETAPFQLAIQRDTDAVPEALVWQIACDDGTQFDGDVVGDHDLSSWQVDWTYILRYAPPLPVDMPDASCSVGIAGETGLLIELGAFDVLARERSFEFTTQPQASLDIQVGEFAQLIGADVPDRLTSPLNVALYWSASGTAITDYTVFVQLLGPDGQVITQIDAQPAQGGAPTSTWLEGQTILDTHILEVPDGLSSGEYTLIAGLYNAQDGTRVPLYDSGGRLDGDYALLKTYTIAE